MAEDMTALSVSAELVTMAAGSRQGAGLGSGLGVTSAGASVVGLAATFSTRTRVPSAKSVRAGDSTVVSFETLPTISTLRLPRIPTVTGTRLIFPLLTT